MSEHRGHNPLEQRRPGDELEPVAKVLRELGDSLPFMHGRRVEVTFDGVATTEDVEHGLGRAYVGGWRMDASTAVAGKPSVITGSVADAAGVDTSTHVRVSQHTAQAVTLYAWVY